MINDLKKLGWLALIMFYLMVAGGCAVDERLVGGNMLNTNRAIITRGIIENATTITLEDVAILHLPTRANVSVSAILPTSQAEIGFQPTQLRAEEAVLSWTEHGQPVRVRLLVPQAAMAGLAGPLTLVYRIFPGGRATAALE